MVRMQRQAQKPDIIIASALLMTASVFDKEMQIISGISLQTDRHTNNVQNKLEYTEMDGEAWLV